MLCSIIIPLYNKADYVSDAIKSVLKQTHQNFEVIIIDDGSKDDGASRVKTFSDPRIKLIQQKNKGVSNARNYGIEQSQGQLICFLDADDWYLPAYLETIVSMAILYPETAFFATNFKRVKNPGKTTTSWEPGDTSACNMIDNLYAIGSVGEFFITNSVAIRRNILEAFKPYFPPGEQRAEDLDLWYRLGEKYSLAYCTAKLTSYRMEVADSLTANNEPDFLLPVFARIEQRALNRTMPDKLRNSALRFVTEAKISVIRRKLMLGHRYDAVKLLIKTWRGLVCKRWWTSLVMCLAVPPDAVRRWENWRIRRLQEW